MSLIAFAIRTCTVRALRGATLAGAAVFDSPVDPSDLATKATTPTIFIYSDAERVEDLGTRDLLAGQRTVDLTLLIVLPATFKATVNGASVEFQDGKAGAATAIDIVYRQIERALIAEESVWSRLWCVFVDRIETIHSHAYVLPVGSAGKQLHLPARGITLSVQTINSPPIGSAPDGVWAELVSAMETAPGLGPLAPLIAGAMEGTALPQWRVDALEVGDTVEDSQFVGDAPLDGSLSDPVPMSEATVDVRTPDTPDEPVTITSDP